ncbi:MAG: YesL family protein [Acidimicrobiia bacterium]
MEMFESRRYRAMERLTDFLLLNAAWVLFSLPLLTLFPATAALFATVRDMQRGNDQSVLGAFWRYLRENFRQAFAIGLLWWCAVALLLFDYVALDQVPSSFRLPLLIVFSLGAASVVLTSTYLFPVMVGYRADWKAVLRNSFLISISQFHTSIVCLLLMFLIGFLAAQIPLTLLLTASVTAYLVQAVCSRGLRRIEQIRGTTT